MKTINSYVCEYCGKSFTNEKDCIEHEKSHSFEKEISDLAYDSFSYIMKLTELSDKYGDEPVRDAFVKAIEELCKHFFNEDEYRSETKLSEDKNGKNETAGKEKDKGKVNIPCYDDDNDITWGNFSSPKTKNEITHERKVNYYLDGKEVSEEDFKAKIKDIMKNKIDSVKDSGDTSLLDYVISKL